MGHWNGNYIDGMKECFKCKRAKPLADFYKHPAMGDGHLGKCAECTRADAMRHRANKLKDPMWVMAERARCRAKSKRRRVAGLEWKPSPEKLVEYRRRYKPKHRVRGITEAAVRAGKIPRRENCQDCGAMGKLHKHHPDYSQPLLIEWLCTSCHGIRHRKAA